MFEKPSYTSIRAFLTDSIAEKQEFPKDVVEKVISFQGEDLSRAFREHNQVELSGFGILYVSKRKLARRIKINEEFLRGPRPKTEEKIGEIEKLNEVLKGKQCQLLKNT